MWHAHLARDSTLAGIADTGRLPCHYFLVRPVVSCASLSSIKFRISRNSFAISRKAAFWSSVGARFDVAGAAAVDAPAYRAASEGGGFRLRPAGFVRSVSLLSRTGPPRSSLASFFFAPAIVYCSS